MNTTITKSSNYSSYCEFGLVKISHCDIYVPLGRLCFWQSKITKLIPRQR